jgi:Uncharacterized conserved protein (DUF2293)
VGRSVAGRALDPEALTAAVIDYIRHRHTHYDDLLMAGHNRREARDNQSQVPERFAVEGGFRPCKTCGISQVQRTFPVALDRGRYDCIVGWSAFFKTLLMGRSLEWLRTGGTVKFCGS